MKSSELREKYLKFFEERGHLIHPSDSLVPDDPTLLYTAAGMVQFKPFFTGERVPPRTRITTSQKCLRTDDIDDVGDASHHTFFEMLGNFSFGDYFKKEAIHWAWEFLIDVLKLPADKLSVSVYKDDQEAYDIWSKEIGLPENRIYKLGEKTNFWPANAPSKGPNGVCGPCSEIFLDTGRDCPDPDNCGVDCDCGRYLELWNLVFTQFDRRDGGELVPLPKKNIDTGMGFERIVKVMQDAPTDYETDLFMPIIDEISKISGVKYIPGDDGETNIVIRVIADHIRGAVFSIADGVMPSNVGRGYVLRRMIRRAVLRGNALGIDRPFLQDLVGVVVDIMKDAYPEPKDRQDYITTLIKSEEEKFRRTLDSGLNRLNQQIEEVRKSGTNLIPGDVAFSLHDTYGFPLELTQEIAKTEGIEVDVEGFNKAMEAQKLLAKESSSMPTALFGTGSTALTELEQNLAATKFVGYDVTESDATVVALLEHGEQVSVAKEGNLVDVVLDVTPFYAESGGQVGDEGEITSDKAVLDVKNTAKAAKFFLHAVKVASGEIKVGDKVHAKVNKGRRMDIGRNHTATHLLHAALRNVLGSHALQSGSVVDPSRLRFDFSHFQAVTPDELRRIENEVNDKILEDLIVNVVETSIDQAREMGATALFGEKYGDTVRVVKAGDYSTEFCGGTHLCRTSEIGLFKIVSESSVGAGLRRIEAVTGHGAVQFVHDLEDLFNEVAEKLGASKIEAANAVERLQTSLKEAQRKIEQIHAKSAAAQAEELAATAKTVGGVNVVASKVATANAQVLSSLADAIADKLTSGVVVLGGVGEGKVLFISKITPDLVKKGFHAGNMIREVAKVAGGGGGGKPDFAQAGGKDASKVDDALKLAEEIAGKQAESAS